jgi:hypothetical protein
MAPSGIVITGAVVAAAIAVGLPILAAVGLGAAVWAGGVAVRLPRGPGRPRTTPVGALAEPWRTFVRETEQAAARFSSTVASVSPGPLQDRLRGLGSRIDASVDEARRVATHGHGIDQALRRIDPARIRHDLAATRRLSGGDDRARTIEALEAQLAAADRLTRASEDGRARLRLLDARLDELVARTVELSLGQGETLQLDGLGTDVEHLVDELDALRRAMAEAGGETATGTA